MSFPKHRDTCKNSVQQSPCGFRASYYPLSFTVEVTTGYYRKHSVLGVKTLRGQSPSARMLRDCVWVTSHLWTCFLTCEIHRPPLLLPRAESLDTPPNHPQVREFSGGTHRTSWKPLYSQVHYGKGHRCKYKGPRVPNPEPLLSLGCVSLWLLSLMWRRECCQPGKLTWTPVFRGFEGFIS